MTDSSRVVERNCPNLYRLLRERPMSPARIREVNESLKGRVMITMSLNELPLGRKEKDEEHSEVKEDHGTDSEES